MLRRALHIDEHVVHISVVVAGVRDPIGTIVVVLPQIHPLVPIHGLQDLLCGLAELSHTRTRIRREIIDGGRSGDVSPRERRALDGQRTVGHRQEKVGEAPRNRGIEDARRETRRQGVRAIFVREPGEDHERISLSLNEAVRGRHRAGGPGLHAVGTSERVGRAMESHHGEEPHHYVEIDFHHVERLPSYPP